VTRIDARCVRTRNAAGMSYKCDEGDEGDEGDARETEIQIR